MNSVFLQGSEDVSRAGHNMQQAADTIIRAAGSIDESGRRMAGQLETHGYQMEALATAMASAPMLRDLFAGDALKGICSSPTLLAAAAQSAPGDLTDEIARMSWAMADAMMKAREA